MINNFSVFYYGITITSENNFLDFDEGSGELVAELNVGSYSLTDFIDEIKRALDLAGGLTYTVTLNRTDRKITIASTAPFDLLTATGTHAGTSTYSLMGFSAPDKTGASTYTGAAGAGYEYITQFKVQNPKSTRTNLQAVSASVNNAVSGETEVIRFGNVRFWTGNLKYITDYQTDGYVIRTNPTGVQDAINLMEYLVTKGYIELMEDMDDRSTYQKLILETTPESDKGVGYELKEMYDKGMVGYWETGNLKFRLIEV